MTTRRVALALTVEQLQEAPWNMTRERAAEARRRIDAFFERRRQRQQRRRRPRLVREMRMDVWLEEEPEVPLARPLPIVRDAETRSVRVKGGGR